jgi:hypothetical protein
MYNVWYARELSSNRKRKDLYRLFPFLALIYTLCHKVGGIDEDNSQIDSWFSVSFRCVDRLESLLYVTNTGGWRQNVSDHVFLEFEGLFWRRLTKGHKLRHLSWAALAWGKVVPSRDDESRATHAIAGSRISVELWIGIELFPSVRSEN